MPEILVTICARGGSKGVPGKNIRPLLGKPLIHYTIQQALAWGKAKHVLVSTDSEAIAKIAKAAGAEVPFLRPAELATDVSAKVPAIRHALIAAEKFYNQRYEVIVDLDPTAPVRTVNDLDRCLELFLRHSPSTLFSVVPARKNPYFNMVEEDASGAAVLCKRIDGHVARRQDAPRVFEMNASIYFYQRNYLLDPQTGSPLSNNSRMYVMEQAASIDIDREIDFKFIEFLLQQGLVKL